MLNQQWMFKNTKYNNIHPWFNITIIIPNRPDDGSQEPKRYSADLAFQ